MAGKLIYEYKYENVANQMVKTRCTSTKKTDWIN